MIEDKTPSQTETDMMNVPSKLGFSPESHRMSHVASVKKEFEMKLERTRRIHNFQNRCSASARKIVARRTMRNWERKGMLGEMQLGWQ